MNDHVKTLLIGITRALVALAVVIGTIAFIWRGIPVPEAWWPAMVAVISFLYGGQGMQRT